MEHIMKNEKVSIILFYKLSHMKKSFLITLVLSVLFLSSCTQKYETVSGKPYDVLNPEIYNGLQSKYNSISDFELGTAVVYDGSKYGLIDSRGKEVFTCNYDTIYPLLNKLRVISLNKKYGVIDENCKERIKCEYDDVIYDATFKYIPFKRNGKWGFLDQSGSIVVQFKYDKVAFITDSVYTASINEKYGLFKYDGSVVVEPKYDFIAYKILNNPKDPSFVYLNDKMAVLNSSNKFVSGFEYSKKVVYSAFPQEGKYIRVAKPVSASWDHKSHRYGLMEYETGKIIIPCDYESMGELKEGLIRVSNGDKHGFVDINNNIVLPFKYEFAEDFSEGLARVAIKGGYYNSIYLGRTPYYSFGFIDKTGKFVIPAKFPDPMLNRNDGDGFHEGLAAMGERPSDNIYAQRFGYIDKTGKYVIQPIYEEAHSFLHGIAIVKNRGKYGCIDKQGNLVVNILYDDHKYRLEKDSLIVLKLNNKEYRFNFDGSPVE